MRLCLKTASRVMASIRWTEALGAALAFVFGMLSSETRQVQALPGNDDMEKIALVQWLRRLGLVRVQQGTGEKSALAMLQQLTTAPRVVQRASSGEL